MSTIDKKGILSICSRYNNAKDRMMDIVIGVQKQYGHVSSEMLDIIAEALETERVEVESTVSFYAFLSRTPKGKVVIRLCDDIIDKMAGYDDVRETFESELKIKLGETSADGDFSLEHTPCIGMCDQAPAAIINDVIFTELDTEKVRDIAEALRSGKEVEELVTEYGDGKNAHPLIRSMVKNNIRLRGPVLFSDFHSGDALVNAIAMSPREVIRSVKAARLRGRGGAGFPTGMKWEFTRMAEGDEKYIICNADEGEPGTFKDRALLTERPDLLLEGMTVAGYAVGASEGIIYLRGEYEYLREYLKNAIAERVKKNLLGDNIYGKEGFTFNIRVQMGAGAYICGEETALISSCEGLRGDPKNRPPFPAQKGYLGHPTVVNNVETLCCSAKIMEKGSGWFAQRGTAESPGTKLLSISGDCELPGIYEVPFGMKVSEMLRLVGAFDTVAVQIGGPSGALIGEDDFERKLCYDDLATGGSVMIFDSRRNILEIVHSFMEFFVEESCGYCTPCRVGNVLLKERLERIMNGLGVPEDLEYLEELGETIKPTSRCGLGQTSANPVLTSLKNFRKIYEEKVQKESAPGKKLAFNIHDAVADAARIAGRKPVSHS